MEIIQNPQRLEHAMKQHKLPEHFQFFQEYYPHFSLIRFKKGEYIYQTDSQRQYLLFFISGKIKVCSNLSNGKSLLVCFFTSFQILGDLEFFQINTSTTTVQAVDSCICISLRITNIRSRLMQDTLFLQFVSESLADKLARATVNHSINLLYPLENKLASYIYQVNENNIFSENLTQLSELLGTSYRHLLRVIKQFTLAGILCKTENGYFIKDTEKLQELAQDLYM